MRCCLTTGCHYLDLGGLDETRFPIGYKHLAYLQTKVGYKVKDDMPGVDGPATDKLYALGANWLKGTNIKNIGW